MYIHTSYTSLYVGNRYIYVHVHTYIHIYIYTYIRMFVCMYVHVCIYMLWWNLFINIYFSINSAVSTMKNLYNTSLLSISWILIFSGIFWISVNLMLLLIIPHIISKSWWNDIHYIWGCRSRSVTELWPCSLGVPGSIPGRGSKLSRG